MAAEQRIQIKRRASAPTSTSAWQGLLDGELGYIKDVNELYIGNGKGVTPTLISSLSWNKLTDKPTRFTYQVYVDANDPTKLIDKNIQNVESTIGYFAPLTNGLIDLKYLPQGALERLVKVADTTARYKLTTSQVQLGDTVQEVDTGVMYIVVDETKLNSADGYQYYSAGRAAAVDWTGVENKPNASQTTAGLMTAADKKKLDNTNVAYGTCTTAAATAAKVITIVGNTNWSLTAGSMISIFFSNTNTAQNPTFNVNNTGAKNVYFESAQIKTSSLGYAGTANRICNYIYDGTQFRFHSWGYDGNTNTQVRVYRQDGTSYNADYPLIASRTKAADLGTVGTESSYEAVYGLISDTNNNIPTTNPYTGESKFKTLTISGNATATKFIGPLQGNADTATKLQTARTVLVNLASTTASSFDGSANITPGVSGILPIINGGTGASTAAQVLINFGITATATELNYTDGVTSNIQTQLNNRVRTDANTTLNDGISTTWTKFTNRKVTITGNDITFDMSAATGGWAGNFAAIKDPVGDTTTMLGVYGGESGLTHIYMGGSYTDPAMKMTKDGYFTFKYTPKVGSINVSLEGHTHSISDITNLQTTLDDKASLTGDNTFTGKNTFTVSNNYNTTDTQKFIVGNNSSAFVFGGDGLQCFAGAGSTTPKEMYINYYGGDVLIGKAGGIQNIKLQGVSTLDGNTTIKGHSGDTPLTVTSKSSGSYILFNNSSGTGLGYIGYSSANTPAVYFEGSAKTIWHTGNFNPGNYLPLAGGNMTGHIYMTGSSASSSTGNTSQIIFGTPSAQHVAISSNDKALVINPNNSATTNQIVLYLNKQSVFPAGIKISAGNLNVSGTSTLTGAVTAQSTLAVTGTSTFTGAVIMNSTLTVKDVVDAQSTVKIGNGVTLQYNSTDKSLNFIFA